MWTPIEIFIIRNGKEMYAITDYDITFTLQSVYLVTDTAQIKESFIYIIMNKMVLFASHRLT
jgi:glutaminase